jgi:non-ribosomal peptide synthetase component F
LVGPPRSPRCGRVLGNGRECVLRADLRGDPAFSELPARVREADLAAFGHQDLPFDRLVEAIGPARVRGRNPLFQMMVVYQDQMMVVYQDWTEDPLDLGALGGTVADLELGDNGSAMFDLHLTLTELGPPAAEGGAPAGGTGGGLRLTVSCAADLFDRETAEALARRLEAVLAQVSADPGLRVGDVDVLLPEERHLVLEAWNDTDWPVPDVTLADLFEAQVRRTPSAIALVADPEPGPDTVLALDPAPRPGPDPARGQGGS